MLRPSGSFARRSSCAGRRDRTPVTERRAVRSSRERQRSWVGLSEGEARMCLGHASHLGASGSDELVPSRYALRIGEIEVLVISDGVLALSAATLATNAEPAALRGWLDDLFLPLETFPWGTNAVVVRSGGRTILIDSGVGAAYPDFPQAGRLAVRLEAAGIDPASLTDVVVTHMHMDHVGGLLVDGLRSRLRPDLRVHVAAAEAEFWESPDFSHTDMPQPIPDVLRKTAGRFR